MLKVSTSKREPRLIAFSYGVRALNVARSTWNVHTVVVVLTRIKLGRRASQYLAEMIKKVTSSSGEGVRLAEKPHQAFEVLLNHCQDGLLAYSKFYANLDFFNSQWASKNSVTGGIFAGESRIARDAGQESQLTPDCFLHNQSYFTIFFENPR